jgi:hypothetical protein
MWALLFMGYIKEEAVLCKALKSEHRSGVAFKEIDFYK